MDLSLIQYLIPCLPFHMVLIPGLALSTQESQPQGDPEELAILLNRLGAERGSATGTHPHCREDYFWWVTCTWQLM